MNTTVLDKCLKTFLDAYLDEQATSDLLFGPGSNFFIPTLEEFRKELALNTLVRASLSEKIDLVKFYITEIEIAKSKGVTYLFFDITYLTEPEDDSNYEARHLKRVVEGLLGYFYIKLLKQIHSHCLIYNLPFFVICDELQISLDGIDITPIPESEKKKTQETSREIADTNIQIKMKEGGNKGFDAILSDISNSENLFWKGIPMEMVIEHFKVLLKSENKYGIPFLTTEQFISFLKRGFLNNKSEPKQKINFYPLKKVLVIKRFR